jgi:hypothetical protein
LKPSRISILELLWRANRRMIPTWQRCFHEILARWALLSNAVVAPFRKMMCFWVSTWQGHCSCAKRWRFFSSATSFDFGQGGRISFPLEEDTPNETGPRVHGRAKPLVLAGLWQRYLSLPALRTRRRLARERKRCFSSSSEDGSRKR